jgi:hypothetical protein
MMKSDIATNWVADPWVKYRCPDPDPFPMRGDLDHVKKTTVVEGQNASNAGEGKVACESKS